MIEIYALHDPRDNAIRYIGKAKDAQKRLKSHLHNRHRHASRLRNWLLELEAIGLKPRLSILVRCSGNDWVRHEREAIASERARNPLLFNIAAGGNQPGEPTDLQLRRLWQAKKRFMQLMPRKAFSEEAKARLRARIEHLYSEAWDNDRQTN